MVTVHYFYDPMCGWCYGATALTKVLNDVAQVQLVMHPGGMIPRRMMDSQFRKMAQQHDATIEQLTKQKFSAAYHQRLSSNEEIILDSFITAQAVSAMQQHYHRGVEMLEAIQVAHYQQALNVSNVDVLSKIAVECGANESDWLEEFTAQASLMSSVVGQSHRLMNQLSVKGFPTFIVEKGDEYSRLPHAQYFEQPSQWRALIAKL